MESRRLLPKGQNDHGDATNRLSLFGIAATASFARAAKGVGDGPPQSLWNRGDCFTARLNAATLARAPPQSLWNRGDCFPGKLGALLFPLSASVSLESRRLLPAELCKRVDALPRLSLFGIAATASGFRAQPAQALPPPQSLWNRGDCFLTSPPTPGIQRTASVSLESRRLLPARFAQRGLVCSAASVSLESRRLLP